MDFIYKKIYPVIGKILGRHDISGTGFDNPDLKYMFELQRNIKEIFNENKILKNKTFKFCI